MAKPYLYPFSLPSLVLHVLLQQAFTVLAAPQPRLAPRDKVVGVREQTGPTVIGPWTYIGW